MHGIGSDDPLVSFDGSGTTSPTYLLADERGSIMAETNSAGTVTTKHQYGPYGEPINQSTSRFRYTGQILLPGTALYHYKARVYHPKLGRFLQTDPIGYKDGMNFYAYVGNDPMNKLDPDGQFGVIGFVFGAALEIGRQAITGEIKNTSMSGVVANVGKVMTSALAGATGAGVAAKAASLGLALRTTVNAGAGAVIGATSATVNNAIDGKTNNLNELTNGAGQAAAFGAAFGTLGSVAGDALGAASSATK